MTFTPHDGRGSRLEALAARWRALPCPVIGRISMDYTTVDVSAVEGVKPGDEVICLGRDGDCSITPDDWATLKGTHAYDIICSLGSRVERVVKQSAEG